MPMASDPQNITAGWDLKASAPFTDEETKAQKKAEGSKKGLLALVSQFHINFSLRNSELLTEMMLPHSPHPSLHSNSQSSP